MSVLSRIRTEYGQIWSISPYLVQMWENKDQNNSEYGHFSRSGAVSYSRKKLHYRCLKGLSVHPEAVIQGFS